MSISIAQLAGSSSFEENLNLIKESVVKLQDRAQKTDILVFPEGFLTGYYVTDTAACAIDLQTAVDELSNITSTSGITVISGFIEKFKNRIYNSAVATDHDGNTLCVYRKNCLFGAWEKASFTSGTEQPIFQFGDWRIGICICYDIEFPDVSRQLALSGAQLIITPTALMQPYGDTVFTLIAARAIENGVHVVYANRVGVERELKYVGGSRVVAPDGKILALAEPDEEIVFNVVLSQGNDAELWDYLPDIQYYFA